MIRFSFRLVTPLIMSIALQAGAQIVNVDRQFDPDSTFNRWSFIGNFAFSSDKQRNNVVDISSNLELDRNFSNNYTLFGIVRNTAVFYGEQSIQNEGQLQLRYRDRDTRKFSLESYLQYQWNGAWGMEFRNVAGSNLRMRAYDREKTDFYLGLGLFREWERWNWSGVRNELVPPDAPHLSRKIFRLNTYTKFSVKVNEQFDFSAISYLQFPADSQFFRPRWYFETNCYAKVSRHFNVVVHWDHIYDTHRLVPIDRFYYTISTGLQLNF